MLRLLLILLLATPFALVPAPAFAADDDDDPDDDDDDDEDGGVGDDDDSNVEDFDAEERRRRTAKKKKRKKVVREVVKGAYAKINMGPAFWLPPIDAWASTSGTEIDFSFGYDVLDKLNFTLTIEGSFFNVITNATGPILFGNTVQPSPVQGDFNMFGGTAAVRFGPNFLGKRAKRLHLAIQVGGGVGYSPLLVDTDTSPLFAANSQSYPQLLQGGPVGLITPAIGLEYYTRLAHFSVGVDVDFNVIVGRASTVAMSVGPTFFVKYTF